ncbi:MAG: hypothetical protein QJR03_15260 [Sphaerobacter sp.]|nr:hypothetical protein [Sphaerobacter sp.]
MESLPRLECYVDTDVVSFADWARSAIGGLAGQKIPSDGGPLEVIPGLFRSRNERWCYYTIAVRPPFEDVVAVEGRKIGANRTMVRVSCASPAGRPIFNLVCAELAAAYPDAAPYVRATIPTRTPPTTRRGRPRRTITLDELREAFRAYVVQHGKCPTQEELAPAFYVGPDQFKRLLRRVRQESPGFEWQQLCVEFAPLLATL